MERQQRVIADVLDPEHVNLAVAAADKATAVDAVLAKLNGDPRVLDFDSLVRAVHERDAPAMSENGCGICIAHGRTDAAHSLVLAAGRLTQGFRSPGIKEPVRLVFVAAIPATFDNEYLRAIGAVARICCDPAQLGCLLAAKTPAEFVQILEAGEIRL